MNYKQFAFKFNVFFLINGFFFDLEIFFFFINFFLLHLVWGIYSIIFDYIHTNKLTFFLFSLVKILLIEILTKISIFFF